MCPAVGPWHHVGHGCRGQGEQRQFWGSAFCSIQGLGGSGERPHPGNCRHLLQATGPHTVPPSHGTFLSCTASRWPAERGPGTPAHRPSYHPLPKGMGLSFRTVY